MNIIESLDATHEHAKNMFVEMYDTTNGIVRTSASHPDLWPGDLYRYVEGALSVGETDIAEGVMEAAGRSIDNDGRLPHYMLGHHPRGWFKETNWFDLGFQAVSGNGIVRSRSGKWVSGIYAPPTFGLAADALVDAGIELPGNFGITELLDADEELVVNRRLLGNWLLETTEVDELTNNSGVLARQLKDSHKAVDLAVNANLVRNQRAIAKLCKGVFPYEHEDLLLDSHRTEAAIVNIIADHHVQYGQQPFSLEMTQAAARLGLSGMIRREDLVFFFKEPNPRDDHPERTRPTFADAIEVARLTSGSFEESRNFLVRALGKLSGGKGAFTRYENVKPSKNAVVNRAHRSQLSTQTAAEAALIAYDMVA